MHTLHFCLGYIFTSLFSMKKILAAYENTWLFSSSEGIQVQVTNMNVKYQLMETWLQITVLLTNFANYVGRAVSYHQNILVNVTKRKKSFMRNYF